VKKQKRHNWEKKKLQWSKERFKLQFYSGSEVHFAEISRGKKIEEHVVTDLDLRNDESRPSLTSGAVAEERQEVSSQITIDEMADTITGGNNLGH